MKQLLIFLIFAANLIYAQNCNCKADLEFTIKRIENNLPGYNKDVNSTTKSKYNSLKIRLLSESQKTTSKSICYKLINKYVEFFADNHTTIYWGNQKNNEPNERLRIKKRDTANFKLNEIKGIYSDNKNKIVVVPSKKYYRDYSAIVLKSDNKNYKTGDVLFDLRKNNDKTYTAIINNPDSTISYKPRFTFKDGILGDIWFKKNLKYKHNFAFNVSKNIEYKKLNDSIYYLRIPTFSANQKSILEPIYKQIDSIVSNTKYLIIDVRNNGGGSDVNVMPLVKYFYDKPIKLDNYQVYVTKDNITSWENWLENIKKDEKNFSKDFYDYIQKRIDLMKVSKNDTFLNQGGENQTYTIKPEELPKYPQKVAIITNKYCASSCESLLIYALSSNKAKILGENSGGYLAYGEVRNIDTPCNKFKLATTLSRFENRDKYETIGIKPDYELNNNSDWLEQTIKILTK